jgi:hypothetical protein
VTPAEILQDLRDIHLPAGSTDAAGVGFVLWPLVLVIALLLLAGWIAWRRRTAWRLEFHRHLDEIERQTGDDRALNGWIDLAILLRRTAMQLSERQDVANLVGDAWLAKLDRLFDTDAFTAGPGRGIVLYPYRDAVDNGETAPMAKQLKETIDRLRHRRPRRDPGP